MSNHPPAAGRRLWAALHLLDRQLLDRDGRMAGCVDDIELSTTAEGTWCVSAILSGPGVLAPRLGARRYGRWRRRTQELWATDGEDHADAHEDPARIPFGRVRQIGSHLTLAAERDELASYATERWARDHLIGRIPGSSHAAE